MIAPSEKTFVGIKLKKTIFRSPQLYTWDLDAENNTYIIAKIYREIKQKVQVKNFVPLLMAVGVSWPSDGLFTYLLLFFRKSILSITPIYRTVSRKLQWTRKGKLRSPFNHPSQRSQGWQTIEQLVLLWVKTGSV